MPSATWSFNGYFSPTLLKKNIKRFWPLWGLYGLGLFFLLPAPILSGIYNYMNGWGGSTVGSLRGAISSTPVIGVCYGLFCAMALFHYLMDHRATQMLHALPIRREGLFLTNWLSALLFILVPNLVISWLTALCAAAARAVGLVAADRFLVDLLLWLGAGTAIPMFFFCFAMFCAMFTGNLLALPVFYGILNFLVLGLYALVADWLLPNLLAGYAGSVPEWCEWFTPAVHLQMLVSQGTGYKTLEAVCYSLVAGCAFTLIALGVYRLRQLERAGDLVTVGWVRPVFQYGFGLCVGLTAGLLVWEQFFYASSWILMGLVALFAVLGAFGGRMLLKKTLRVFADGWKGVAGMAAVLALLLVGVRADFFGYQRWVPQPEQVESVYVSGMDSYPNDGGSYLNTDITDPALIQQVLDIHAGMVSDLSRVAPDAPNIPMLWDERNCQTQGPVWLELRYTMENGEVISRRYNGVPIYQSELETEGTYAWGMERLLNEPELVQRAYFREHDPEELEAVDGWLENLRPAPGSPQEGVVKVEIEAAGEDGPQVVSTSDRDGTPVLTADQARQLWAAVRADLETGDIGRRYLLNNAQRRENCYYSDVYLTLAYTDVDEAGNRHTGTRTVGFTVQTTSAHTLKALEELGYKDRLSLREDYRG